MNRFAKIKTVVVDLDRTLLRTDKTLSSYTVNILRNCRKSGILVMVATARPLRTIEAFCDMFPFDAMTVSNGARVVTCDNQIEFGISENTAVSLLNSLCCHSDLRITLETGDQAYSNKLVEDYETILTDDLIGVAKAEGALKILVHSDNEDTLSIVKQCLTDDLYYTVAHGYLIQIMNKAATKWNGIKAMLDSVNASIDETAYFGDDQDDIEPIQLCGMGVGVANAIKDVKAVADFICEGNDSDGVAKFIEKMIL